MTSRITRRSALIGGATLALAGCGSRRLVYNGPAVTRVAVFKASRRMYLMHNANTLTAYNVALGWAPVGDKKVEGDGKTPEGDYLIDRRNPESQFHLSLGIDYPRAHDIAEAEALGQKPGGDIFIHGEGRPATKLGPDWTWGCVAVTNPEMEEVYSMVRTGTVVSIYP